MRKEDKGIIINNIAETLKQYSCFYLVETTGLNAEKPASVPGRQAICAAHATRLTLSSW